MISFKQHITELFDKPAKWNEFGKWKSRREASFTIDEMDYEILVLVKRPIVTSVATRDAMGNTKYINCGVAYQKYLSNIRPVVCPLNSLSERSMNVEI